MIDYGEVSLIATSLQKIECKIKIHYTKFEAFSDENIINKVK